MPGRIRRVICFENHLLYDERQPYPYSGGQWPARVPAGRLKIAMWVLLNDLYYFFIKMNINMTWKIIRFSIEFLFQVKHCVNKIYLYHKNVYLWGWLWIKYCWGVIFSLYFKCDCFKSEQASFLKKILFLEIFLFLFY